MCILILIYSCKEKVEVDFDCREVATEIKELRERVGTYTSSNFTNSSSSKFEEAAIAIYVENSKITTETETSCFSFTALPQRIQKVRITSSNSVISGGKEFASGEDLTGLFKLHNMEQT